jgi:hypothetical protein
MTVSCVLGKYSVSMSEDLMLKGQKQGFYMLKKNMNLSILILKTVHTTLISNCFKPLVTDSWKKLKMYFFINIFSLMHAGIPVTQVDFCSIDRDRE